MRKSLRWQSCRISFSTKPRGQPRRLPPHDLALTNLPTPRSGQTRTFWINLSGLLGRTDRICAGAFIVK